jgi:hypothetical protein
MSFRILGADGTDRERWHEVLERFPAHRRDLHYLPEYGLIYRDCYGHEPQLAVYEQARCTAIHAFLRRPLAALPFLAQAAQAGAFADIATPYGFGGPLLSNEDAPGATDCLAGLDASFRRWCAEARLASEFACLHPVLGNHTAVAAAGIVPLNRAKEVVVIDLQPPDDALWAGVSRGTRSSIQRARRSGVSVEQVAADADALEAFRTLYVATMKRRSAAARWYFPDSYFSDCVRRLGPDMSALFFARCEGTVAAAYLLLSHGTTAYYHFGGSDERWLERRPNNLLMYETLRWARQKGFAQYHLGGGVTASENDSLLRFKSSFGGRRALLYTYCRVLNEDVYRLLCEYKRGYEARSGQPVADPDYFPFYRR